MRTNLSAREAMLFAATFLAAPTFAQTGATASAPAPASSGEDPVELSPFVVSSAGDEGYRATNTLAGTRLRTGLMETPAAISVLTKDLLDDLGAENTADYFRMATNTRFDMDGDANAGGSQQNDAPAKIRGLGGASVTRDYFSWGLPTDIFNVERVDVNRGPNAVLYGIGAPGGVINTTSKQAHLNSRKQEASVTFGSWNKRRAEIDFGLPLIANVLALRLNAVTEDREGWRDFEFFRQNGLALASTFKPFRNTVIRGGYEARKVDQLKPIGTAQDLGGTRWLAAGAPLGSNPIVTSPNPYPTLWRSRNIEQVMYAPQLRSYPFRISTIGADMRPDLPGTQASGFWDTLPGAGTLAQGQVDDPHLGTLVPLRSNLSGPGGTADFDYSVGSLYLEQRVGNFFFEVTYRKMRHWRDNRAVGVSGLIGDPNPVLPGAYYADGDSRVATDRLPGTLLPDIGARNPRAGQLYVEGTAQTRIFDSHRNQYRATLGWDLDLTKRSHWLGRHSLAALWQRDDEDNWTWVLREFNLAPNNNQLIDATTNNIIRRTYLDFNSPGGLRGAIDPWANPLEAPGVKSGFVYNAPSGQVNTLTESWMVSGQSKFLDGRLVFTAGYRDDKLANRRGVAGGIKIPNSSNLWSKIHDVLGAPETFEGKTRTLGVVAFPFRRLALTYNQSNSLQPQTALNAWSQPVGSRKGEGKDWAARLSLVDNRLYLNVNHYQIKEKNRVGQFIPQRQAIQATVNAVIDTLRILGRPFPASMMAAQATTWGGGFPMQDQTGRGQEVELVGTITRHWSISLNVSRNYVGLANIAPFEKAFLAEVAPEWKGNRTPITETPAGLATFVRTRDNTPGRDFVLNPATFNDALEHAIVNVDDMDRSNGQAPMQHVRDSLNVFTSYRFEQDASFLLRKTRFGLGCNLRSAPVIGYDAARNNASIFGRTEFLVNFMAGRKFPAGRNRTLDVQLNVQNLFGKEDLMPFNSAVPGVVLRYMYPSVMRSWALKATYHF